MKKIIDSNEVSLPTCWGDLTPENVYFVAKAKFEMPTKGHFMTQCLLHFMGLRPKKGIDISETCTALRFNFSNGKEVVKIDAITVMTLLERIEWLNETFGLMKCPNFKNYISPDYRMYNVSLEQFMNIDKLYSDFMNGHDSSLLHAFFNLLYKRTKKAKNSPSEIEKMTVIYWFSGFKIWLREKYPYVFSGGYGEDEYEETPVQEYLIGMIASLNEGRAADNNKIKKGDLHEMLYELNRKIEFAESQKSKS
jgi:hypothetical protein